MRAATYTAMGSPDVIKVAQVPKPTPGKGQVLIKVAAASVNPLDLKVRSGHFPPMMVSGAVWPPKNGSTFIAGHDMAGVVESVPAGSKFSKGQRVAMFTARFGSGSFAEYMLVPETEVAVLPDGVSMVDGAAVSLVGVTALQLLKKLGPAKQGATLLVTGGAGGVGSLLVQMAAQRGYTVTTTASAKNAEKVKALGAAVVVDYKQEPDPDAYAVKVGGFDAIIDVVGKSAAVPPGKALKNNGLYVRLLGGSSMWVVFSFMLGAVSRLVRMGPRFTIAMAAPNSADLTEVLNDVAQGKLKPQVDRVFSGLDQAQATHEYVEGGQPQGKVVLVVDATLQ